MAPILYRIQSANKLKIPVKDVVAATIIFKTCQKHEISIFFLSCVMCNVTLESTSLCMPGMSLTPGKWASPQD